ncbi:MAG: glycosyltransferase family 2 protein [Hydrogenophaga sp.]|uniref:glycosyltransferase family 2 protein n=1 Tax=Hydrogenophaga sp. TaxID=1904254 RepID=UPI001DEEF3F0|nr:glycosyltransferase family 2 protein [Hydrogenophaga sp.]MBX3610051.1 glycosyltransferase family 2 protein [Hydrogenophaga sp.]
MNPVPETRPTLCVGILAVNESRRIAACIASARFADQIIVFDSGSTDGTREVAAEAGAEVHLNADWQGFAVQRNRLLEHVRCDYVFFLDADEIVPPELADEISRAVQSGEDAVWEVQWNQVAYGRALTLMKSTGGIRRLFRADNLSHFAGVVHEDGVLRRAQVPCHRFRNRLLHYSRETVYDSLLKLAQYVQLGASKRAEQGKRGGVLRGMASAFAIFVRLYIFRRGFLCGAEGFLFCFFIALECFFRYAALRYDRLGAGQVLARR